MPTTSNDFFKTVFTKSLYWEALQVDEVAALSLRIAEELSDAA